MAKKIADPSPPLPPPLEGEGEVEPPLPLGGRGGRGGGPAPTPPPSEWTDQPPTGGGRYEYDPATGKYRQVEPPTSMERPQPPARPAGGPTPTPTKD